MNCKSMYINNSNKQKENFANAESVYKLQK